MSDERSRAEAQARADRIRPFHDELDALQREGVLRLSPEQRAAIDAHHAALLERYARDYDTDVSSAQKRMSRGMQVAATLAALALSAALVLLMLRIWGLLPTGAQVGVLAGLPIALLGVLELVTRRRSLQFLVGVVGLVTFAAFVLDVEAMSQIFAIAPRPEGLLAYGVVAVSLAYGYGLRVLLVAGTLLLAGWFAAMTVHLSGAWWGAVVQRPESVAAAGVLLFGCAFLPHASRPDFPAWYRGVALTLVSFALILLGQAGELSWLRVDDRPLEASYVILSFLVSTTALVAGVRMGWTEVVVVGGLAFAVASLIQLTEWWWDWMPHWLFFLVIGLIAIGVLVAFRAARSRGWPR
jgi:hypothetical protein